jgi:hypothetical protein
MIDIVLAWLSASRVLRPWTPTPNWRQMVHLFQMLQTSAVSQELLGTSPVPDASDFCSLAGALHYLTFTGRILLIQFNRFACTYTIRVSLTLLL